MDGAKVKDTIESYLSRYGKVSFVENRNLLVVEDSPEFLRRVDALIAAVYRRPRQVMIEARILEVTLNDDENLGIDWRDVFQGQNGDGTYGARGFIGAPDSAGFFFTLATPNVTAALNALRDEGRLRTLSTPKLVALEKQEASVVIGDRRGYQVTTTINQVTTESIEFLESGVILRVTVEIDEDDRILMSVHPEVSNGTVDANGIPSQTTTEVTTNLLIPSGETVFIGGLIKKTETEQRQSVPLLNKVPMVRRLFAGTENSQITTETVVLISPLLADDLNDDWNQTEIERVNRETIDQPNYRKWHSLTRNDRKPAAKPASMDPVNDPLRTMQKPELIAMTDDHATNTSAVVGEETDSAVEPFFGAPPGEIRPVPDIWPIIEVAVPSDSQGMDFPVEAAASAPATLPALPARTKPTTTSVVVTQPPPVKVKPVAEVKLKRDVSAKKPVAVASREPAGVRWLN